MFECVRLYPHGHDGTDLFAIFRGASAPARVVSCGRSKQFQRVKPAFLVGDFSNSPRRNHGRPDEHPSPFIIRLLPRFQNNASESKPGERQAEAAARALALVCVAGVASHQLPSTHTTHTEGQLPGEPVGLQPSG